MGTAQHGAHTGQEFFHPERLGQVIVSTEIKRGDLLALSIQRSQHDDGHGRVLAHAPTDFEAVHARHHDVQNQQMGVFPLPQGYSLQPIARFQYFKAAGTQVRTRPASHPRNTKFNVMLTPESTNTWYLGASPGGAGITESGSKLRSLFGAGYSGRVGSSLRYELRVSRESSTTTRVQLAVKF